MSIIAPRDCRVEYTLTDGVCIDEVTRDEFEELNGPRVPDQPNRAYGKIIVPAVYEGCDKEDAVLRAFSRHPLARRLRVMCRGRRHKSDISFLTQSRIDELALLAQRDRMKRRHLEFGFHTKGKGPQLPAMYFSEPSRGNRYAGSLVSEVIVFQQADENLFDVERISAQPYEKFIAVLL